MLQQVVARGFRAVRGKLFIVLGRATRVGATDDGHDVASQRTVGQALGHVIQDICAARVERRVGVVEVRRVLRVGQRALAPKIFGQLNGSVAVVARLRLLRTGLLHLAHGDGFFGGGLVAGAACRSRCRKD